MSEHEIPQTTLRETLEANVNASEAGTLPTIEEARDQRPRDEVGRFAPKPKEEATPAVTPQAPAPQGAQPIQALQRPTTWKKEYLPTWDKIAAGDLKSLTADELKKLAEYSNQRENEYKTGVSTYKAEAENAKQLQEAITPFLPELQANNTNPAQWIKQMGTAHYALIKGTPELKLQVFRELAKQYGVPIGAILQHPDQVPPIVNDLLSQIAELKQQVSGVTSWRDQQQTTSLTSEIERYAKDTVKYPHFEAVRGTMAQILESGLAQDLDSAYDKAIWMHPEVRDAELLRRTEAGKQSNVIAKAKAQAVSPKSATPSGQVATADAKDRRATLSERFDALGSGRV